MNFTGNHDTGRIGHFIEQANADASEEEKLARLKLAYAFTYFARGIPVIYYGDEQGFTGDGDSDNSRQDMMPGLTASFNDDNLIGTDATTADDNFDESHPAYQALQLYSTIYKLHPTLRRGIQVERYVENGEGIYAFSRIDSNNLEYLVLFNTSTEEKTVTLDSTSANYLRAYPLWDRSQSVESRTVTADSNDNVTFTVPALDFQIFAATDEIAAIEENLAATFNNPADGAVVMGEVQVGVDISSDNQSPLSLYDVHFEAKVGVDGEFTSLGHDFTPDYKVFWDTSAIENGTPVTLRATVVNSAGQEVIAESNVVVDVVEGMTAYFQKPADWPEAKLYFFDSAAPSPEWPGVAMRSHGDNWYSYQFPVGVQSATLIFNGGLGESQTANLPRIGDGCYDISSDSWTDSCTVPMYVYFQKPESWGEDLNIHYFDAPPASNTSWPGEALNNLGEDWYSFKFPDGVSYASLIFNDGQGHQTANLYRETTGCYDIDSNSWSNECDVPEQQVDLGPYGTDIYVRGAMNDWGTSMPLTYLGDNQYQATYALDAGDYQFKIADSDWSNTSNFGAWWNPVTQSADGTVEFNTPVTIQNQAGTNLSLTVTEAGDNQFSLDANGDLITEPTLTVSPIGPYGDTALFVRGSFNGWGTSYELVYQGAGEYRTSIALNAGEHIFKVADNAWSAGSNFGVKYLEPDLLELGVAKPLQDQSSTNARVVLDATGSYQFSLTVDPDGLITEPSLVITAE